MIILLYIVIEQLEYNIVKFVISIKLLASNFESIGRDMCFTDGNFNAWILG